MSKTPNDQCLGALQNTLWFLAGSTTKETNNIDKQRCNVTHGNVTFDILESPAFQKYSTCWVLSLSLSL